MGWKGGTLRELLVMCSACICLGRYVTDSTCLYRCECITCSTYIQLCRYIPCRVCMHITANLRFFLSHSTILQHTRLCGNCLVLHRAGDCIGFGGSFQCPCTTVSLISSGGTIMHLPLHLSDAWDCGILHLIGLLRILLVGVFMYVCGRHSLELQPPEHRRD
jgi:hypothetical protein